VGKSAVDSPASKPHRTGQFTRWCLGTILGVLVLSVIGNLISATVPNVFVWTWKKIFRVHQQKIWQAAAIKNDLEHQVALTVWSDSQGMWIGDTWNDGDIKTFVEENPIRVMIQGDFVAQLQPPRLTHTYEGTEAYVLESTLFDHEPTTEELTTLKPNRIVKIIGGPNPKSIPFVDGALIPFDVLNPLGKRLKIESAGESVDMLPNKLQPDATIYTRDPGNTNRP
jgi:hypothetical protein